MSNDVVTYPLPSFKVLRELAAQPVAKACIGFRRQQVMMTGWDIKPAAARSEMRANEARAWFAHPERLHNLRGWLDVAVRDVLEVDGLTVFRRRTIGKHAGLLGSDLAELLIVDAGTITPVLDDHGQLHGLVQSIGEAGRGVPLVSQAGQPMSPVPWCWFTLDDALYRPRNCRTWTPYGCSPVEAVIAWADDRRTLIDFAATDARMPAAFGLDVAEDNGKIKVVADNLPHYADGLRYWLKDAVFDHVLHEVCGADDLEWMWLP